MTVERHWFILSVNPEPWEVGPISVGRGKRGSLYPIVGRAQQMYAYQQAVKSEILRYKPRMWHGKLDVRMWFWRCIDEYKTEKAQTARKHDADATNLFKSTEDALQGILYVNDKDNSITKATIVAQGPDVTPMVVISIENIEDNLETRTIGEIPDAMYEEISRIRSSGLITSNEVLESDGWVPGEF